MVEMENDGFRALAFNVAGQGNAAGLEEAVVISGGLASGQIRENPSHFRQGNGQTKGRLKTEQDQQELVVDQDSFASLLLLL